jgi:hypothetical protein
MTYVQRVAGYFIPAPLPGIYHYEQASLFPRHYEPPLIHHSSYLLAPLLYLILHLISLLVLPEDGPAGLVTTSDLRQSRDDTL